MFEMRRSQYLSLGAVLVASSLALFFVGREAASWRPQRVSKGEMKAAQWDESHHESATKVRLRMVRKRFGIKPSDIVAVSRDGKWMARGQKVPGSRDDFRFDLRDTISGKMCVPIDYDQGQPEEVQFSPCGHFFAIRFYGSITMLFDTRTGARLWTRPAMQILFSPDEKMVVCARQVVGRHGDGRVAIWTASARTGNKIRIISAMNRQTLLPIGFDGPDHIRFGDFKDNIWRVRVR